MTWKYCVDSVKSVISETKLLIWDSNELYVLSQGIKQTNKNNKS